MQSSFLRILLFIMLIISPYVFCSEQPNIDNVMDIQKYIYDADDEINALVFKKHQTIKDKEDIIRLSNHLLQEAGVFLTPSHTHSLETIVKLTENSLGETMMNYIERSTPLKLENIKEINEEK